ncbi:MAG TPA: coproporphyrinogen-III oxidase family protein [Planctomycetaceae bacterium]|nr:coproporphyrinogen-III oxidase family protein [Planctomycetaceae bacterium]
MTLPTESVAECLGCEPPEPSSGNYFVSSYPPFSCWNKEQLDRVPAVFDKPVARATEVPLGLYLHVPFCAERCHYCYYRSYAQPTHDQTDHYIDVLLNELATYAKTPAVAGRDLDFAYFGGGTPSLLSVRQIQRLFDGIRKLFPFDSAREVTFECAPQSATEDRLRVLRDVGVTRISMGVQQLDDEVLRKSGRIHRVENVERAWERIEPLGFPVVNLDLMVGLVGETEESFFRSLKRIIEMGPPSVTIYLLEIPPNTPLFHALQDHQIEQPPAPWDIKRDRMRRAFETLEHSDYAIRSAYAAVRDLDNCRFVYQDAQYHGADLLGVGVASFSYFDGVHYQNQASLDRYLQSVSEHGHARARACELADDERMVREFVLQLKLGGVSAAYFQKKFGINVADFFAEPLSNCEQRGWLKVDNSGVTLTRDGLLRVDRLIPSFYLPRHLDKTYW